MNYKTASLISPILKKWTPEESRIKATLTKRSLLVITFVVIVVVSSCCLVAVLTQLSKNEKNSTNDTNIKTKKGEESSLKDDKVTKLK